MVSAPYEVAFSWINSRQDSQVSSDVEAAVAGFGADKNSGTDVCWLIASDGVVTNNESRSAIEWWVGLFITLPVSNLVRIRFVSLPWTLPALDGIKCGDMDNEVTRSADENLWKLQLFSGFRLRTPSGLEFQSKSRRMVSLITYLALQRDFSCDRHSLAQSIYWDYEDNHEQRLKLLLSRTSNRLKDLGCSFLRITSDSVWLDPNMVEIDIQVAFQLLDAVAEAGNCGKPIRGVFSALGDLISPITFSNEAPCVEEAISHLKRRFLHQIVTKLVPVSGIAYSNYVSALVETLGLEDYESATNCAQLMSIYAGIGDKGAVHRVFSRHEITLDEEFGEVVAHPTHEAYALALQMEPFPGERISPLKVPAIPKISFGFDEITRSLISLIDSSRSEDLIYLQGCDGSGKTHLLSRVYHELLTSKNVVYVDLSQLDDMSTLRDEQCDQVACVLLDGFESQFAPTVRALSRIYNTAVIVCAGQSVCKMPSAVKLCLPQLDVGNRFQVGPGVSFFATIAGMNKADLLELESGKKLSSIQELVQLSGGNPATIESCAELGKVLGLDGAVNYIRNDLTGLLSRTSHSRAKTSLKNHFISRIEALDPEALKSLKLLSRLNGPIVSDLLTMTGHVDPAVLIDLANFGLISLPEDGIVEVILPVREILGASVFGAVEPGEWSAFCSATLLWLRRMAESPSENLVIAKVLRTFCGICSWLLDGDRQQDGLQMYGLLSSWFASSDFDKDLPAQAEAVLISKSDLKPVDWSKSVYAIGKGFISRGLYSRCLQLLSWATSCYTFQCLSDNERYPIINQLGLVHRCLGDFESAKSYYQHALTLVPTISAKVTVHFNLGCLAEGQGLFGEALEEYESAAKSYTETVDSRLLIQNTIALLRLRTLLSPDLVNTSETLNRLFKDTLLTQDTRSQATLVMDVGEFKQKSGQTEDAVFYMVTGVLMFLELGYTLNTASKCLPVLQHLSQSLSWIGLDLLADYVGVLAEALESELSRSQSDDGLQGNLVLPRVLREVLLECIQLSLKAGFAIPVELEPFIKRSEAVKAASFDYTPVVPFIETLRANRPYATPVDSSLRD